MYVSEDSIVTIVSVVGLLIALGGGFAWVVQRMDTFSKNMDAKFEVLNTRTDLAKDVAFLRSDVSVMRKNVDTLRIDVEALREDVAQIRGEIRTMQQDTKENHNEMAASVKSFPR